MSETESVTFVNGFGTIQDPVETTSYSLSPVLGFKDLYQGYCNSMFNSSNRMLVMVYIVVIRYVKQDVASDYLEWEIHR